MRLFNLTRLNPLGLAQFDGERNTTTETLVVFFGDSRARSWTAPALPRATFANRGIDGQTSRQCLLRFDEHVAPLAPDLVILQVGINDLAAIASLPQERDALVEETGDNIAAIVSRARALGAKVIVTTIFPPGRIPLSYRPFWSDEIEAAVTAVNERVRGMAGEGVVIFDTVPVLAGSDGRICSQFAADALHLNGTGYAALNEALIPVLEAQVER